MGAAGWACSSRRTLARAPLQCCPPQPPWGTFQPPLPLWPAPTQVDNFELAKQQLVLESEGEKRVDAAYQGLYKQMVELFRGLGLEATPGAACGQALGDDLRQRAACVALSVARARVRRRL